MDVNLLLRFCHNLDVYIFALNLYLCIRYSKGNIQYMVHTVLYHSCHNFNKNFYRLKKKNISYRVNINTVGKFLNGEFLPSHNERFNYTFKC